MSDKNKLDDEIEQELEDRLEDGQGITEGEDDFTVKVHREDYTVKRRFYDKEKALETADSLRLDKENVVEDNIDHDFVTLVEEEDDVDWDKLVDGGLAFYPPISDAADRKLDNASNVAEELAAESARVGSELDKTMTMSSKIKIDYPKIEPKVKEPEIKEEKATGVLDSEIEVDDLGDVEIDIDVTEDAEIDEDVIDEEIELSVKKKHGKTGGFVKKIVGLLVILVVAAGLYFYGTKPTKELDTMPAVQEETVAQKAAVQPEKPPVSAVPLIPAQKAGSEKVAEQAEPVMVDAVPEPVQPEAKIPEVTKFYPYTIWIV